MNIVISWWNYLGALIHALTSTPEAPVRKGLRLRTEEFYDLLREKRPGVLTFRFIGAVAAPLKRFEIRCETADGRVYRTHVDLSPLPNDAHAQKRRTTREEVIKADLIFLIRHARRSEGKESATLTNPVKVLRKKMTAAS
jgi:hypothetical protein